jgi:hypothetical protein
MWLGFFLGCQGESLSAVLASVLRPAPPRKVVIADSLRNRAGQSLSGVRFPQKNTEFYFGSWIALRATSR